MTRQSMGRAGACTLVAFGAVVGLSGPASATVVFDSTILYTSSSTDAEPVGAGTSATVSTGPGQVVTASIPAGPLTALSYSQSDAIVAAKFPKPPTVQAEASDTESVQANFFGPSSGTAEFVGAATAKVITPGAGAFALSGLSYFVYNFTLDQKSSIDIGYDVSANSTFSSSFPGYSVYVYDPSFSLFLDQEGLQNASGSFGTILGPGDYTLEIDNSIGNDFATSTAGLQSGSAVGDFGFSISTVPEPATWAILLVGFGGLGLAMRGSRRRRAATA